MKTTLEIQNLKCGGCEATIYNKLKEITTITEVFVDLDTSTIRFNYCINDDVRAVKEALLNIGYPVIGEENKLMTKAKSFVSCAIGRVRK